MLTALCPILLCLIPSGSDDVISLFKPPFQVKADGEVIDVEVGHAAPLFTDFDGDGLEDLLVGQFGEGKLRVYRNVGEKGAPKFASYEWFQAGGADGTIPSG